MNTRAGKLEGLLTDIRGQLRRLRSTRWGGTSRLHKLVPTLPWLALAALALLALAAVTLLPPLITPDLDDPQAQFEVRNEAFRTVAAIVGGLVLVAGVFINWQRVSQLERQVNAAELGQITERFTRAIDQLGAVRSDNEPAPEIRAGGVRSLERIAGESVEDFWPVLDILTAYVRSESRAASPDVEILGAEEIFEIDAHEIRNRMDVAFTVDAIQRLWPFERETDEPHLNLAHAFLPWLSLPGKDLGGANLEGAYLRGADFSGASLGDAYLPDADLEDAHLREAYLGGSSLQGSNLKGADFYAARLFGANLGTAHLVSANLRITDLRGAHLREANLKNADLLRAHLSYANLKGADLRGANLEGASLEGATLDGVCYDDDTQWPEGFTPPPSAQSVPQRQ